MFRVTASVTFEYDPEDGIVTSIEEGQQDMLDVLMSGDLSPSDFTIDVEEVE